MIAVRSELEFVNVKSSSTIELISGAVKLSKNKKTRCCFTLQALLGKLVVAFFYSPPNMVDEQYLSQLLLNVSSVNSTRTLCIYWLETSTYQT